MTSMELAERVQVPGDRIVGRVDGAEAGPTLICVGGLHGNETSGIDASRRVIRRLEESGARERMRGSLVAVAGNVGTPLTSLVGALDSEATVVCECSSFQLEDSDAFAPEIAVFLNFAPDHLDRHRSLEGYLAAKLRIFANQGPDAIAVLSALRRVRAPVFCLSCPAPVAQLDRVLASEAKGHRFESCRARHFRLRSPPSA